eukprot:TRINITY_DN785_c0_g1_i1.p1 TRINITY_DN785_c0_g1~~TRINITY_DN785_c0_g1_i1.p1  ORF type:complete len:120 (+),score=36.25 TRINITY_DN785_c0_g1_i1:57-362(+)
MSRVLLNGRNVNNVSLAAARIFGHRIGETGERSSWTLLRAKLKAPGVDSYYEPSFEEAHLPGQKTDKAITKEGIRERRKKKGNMPTKKGSKDKAKKKKKKK